MQLHHTSIVFLFVGRNRGAIHGEQGGRGARTPMMVYISVRWQDVRVPPGDLGTQHPQARLHYYAYAACLRTIRWSQRLI
jgi:hypothetical protein